VSFVPPHHPEPLYHYAGSSSNDSVEDVGDRRLIDAVKPFLSDVVDRATTAIDDDGETAVEAPDDSTPPQGRRSRAAPEELGRRTHRNRNQEALLC
jgi:hypothetical protein